MTHVPIMLHVGNSPERPTTGDSIDSRPQCPEKAILDAFSPNHCPETGKLHCKVGKPAVAPSSRPQAANRADFSDAVTLYRIVDCPFYIQQVEVTPTKSYRYYRFLPAPQFNCSIAEWSLFVQRGEDQVQLKGTIMDSDSADRKELEKAFDDNQVTFYESKGSLNAWIGMDAGKPERLVRMCFSPRGDGNGIIPGYAYELLYFDGGWKSLGSKTAQTEKSDKTVVLQFPAVPVGALLWLKCHTEGKEERIFTYQNGKQVWW